MPLVTRNVFIDTEFFVKANLDFHSKTIKYFEGLCGDGELKHITSTVVINEVNRKITEQIRDALKGIKNFRRKASVLREFDEENIKSLFVEINENELIEKAISTFDNFIDSCDTSIVDMSEVDGNEIISMFFNQQSPFSAKKPNEFRDAFSLLAIKSELGNHERIYVVSADTDHTKFCEQNENFVNIDTLDALLNLYNTHNDERAEFINDFLKNSKNAIKQSIIENLEQADAYNYSTWEDAELDSFEVKDINDFEPQIIYLDDESCQMTFDITVKFLANVSGPDFTNGYYDREDGVVYTFDTVMRQEEEEHNFSVELNLSFESDAGEFISDDFELNIQGLSQGIEFSVEETPWEDPR